MEPPEKTDPENKAPEGRGRFKKGQSGNPGGRPKGVAEFQRACLERVPRALKVADEILESGEDKVRASVVATLLKHALPLPRHGDDFDKPMPVELDPEKITTLGLVSDARMLLAAEIQRLKTVSGAGIPLSESATVRLTEVVKQLGVLAEQEKKLSEADPFANKTTEEIEQLWAEDKLARSH